MEQYDNLFLKRTKLNLNINTHGQVEQPSYDLADIVGLFKNIGIIMTADGINLSQFLKFMYSNGHNITGKEILLLKKLLVLHRKN